MDHTNAVLVVWEACIVGDDAPKFINWIQDQFDINAEYAEEYVTVPTIKNGKPVTGTGGRNDVLFWVDKKDISHFCFAKIQIGARWYEDVVSPVNGGGAILPEYIREKYKEAA